ncbi:uncharacterized protein LOC128209056 isoform X2 [Mya arenaria]|uniref:uncharacterized protein LOC128209056 isoform X2 n=1 Tax=Mya arenaria TaxID=6604 RepID=UPI0022E7F7DC|nr:uncharacterized protein LOC128209056 isoform X2 [Mya arenaria]
MSGEENAALLKSILTTACYDGSSLLHIASKEDQFDIVRALLSTGADPTVKDLDGHFPYQVSVSEKTRHVYRELLLQAASQSKIPQLKQLIESGVGVNFSDAKESANTPLHWAASFADINTVRCLCEHGADVHAVNMAGCSPLHDGVERGNSEIVHCLLQYGADPALQITQGKCAGMTCYELGEGKPEVLDVLNNPPPILDVGIEGVNREKMTPLPEVRPHLTLPNGSIPKNGSIPLRDTASPVPTPQLMSPVFKRSKAVEMSLSGPLEVVTEEKLSRLWPQPQSIEQQEGPPLVITGPAFPVMISMATGSALREIKKKWLLYKDKFAMLNLALLIEPFTPLSDLDETHVVCHVSQRLCPEKGGYKLTVMKKQVKILSHDINSLHHAIATLLQLLRMYRDNEKKRISIPQLRIDDWPDVPYRGALLDISQGRVPNVETFKETVKLLASLKINQIYLYIRFRHLEQVVWQICYGVDELTDLDDFCHEYGIELCPVLEVAPTVQYEHLNSLYPLFQDFLTCFGYNQFVSVGPRLSSFLLDVDAEEELSLSDCSTLLPVRSDQTLQLCGYPLHDLDKHLFAQIPPHIVFNEYGVQATHNYTEVCKPLSTNGLSFIVCPGTAAWTSLAGCPEAAITNVYNAVKCATAEGAIGVIVCNWSGKGHLTHLPFSWPGFLMGAGLSWNSDCHYEYCLGNLEDLLNEHVFEAEGGVVGHAIVELGRAETYLLRCARCQTGEECSDLPADNGSLLYQFLLHPDSSLIENLNPDMLQKVTRHVRKCQTELKTAELHCAQGASVLTELQHTCDLMLLACKIGRALVVSGKNPGGQAGCDVVNFGVANLSPTVKTDLANRLLELLDVYETLWKGRYLEPGLKFYLTGFQSVLKQFIPEGDPRAGGDKS